VKKSGKERVSGGEKEGRKENRSKRKKERRKGVWQAEK
jgi:hypothetical protein